MENQQGLCQAYRLPWGNWKNLLCTLMAHCAHKKLHSTFDDTLDIVQGDVLVSVFPATQELSGIGL